MDVICEKGRCYDKDSLQARLESVFDDSIKDQIDLDLMKSCLK